MDGSKPCSSSGKDRAPGPMRTACSLRPLLSPSSPPSPSGRGSWHGQRSDVSTIPGSLADWRRSPLSLTERFLPTGTSHIGSPSPPAEVAQISNLLYRRFPIGKTALSCTRRDLRKHRRLEALRYSRLEICATWFVGRARVRGNRT